MPSID
ncbi:unnamed protein product [Linum tenue]